jgi:hypothetical protein
MLRYTALPMVFALLFANAVSAQPFRDQDGIEGRYFHQGTGGTCRVSSRGSTMVFENEQGSRARFSWVAPNTLRLVNHDGGWDPSMSVQVFMGRGGRITLRFTTPRGFVDQWTSAR